MMPAIRVYCAQPVDFVPITKLKESVEGLQGLVEGLPVEIVAPYLDEQIDIVRQSGQFLRTPLDRKLAQQIVERDYAVLDTCDILLVDLSREDRQAVGMIFEMAHARSKGKVIVVYTGGSSLGKRVWIVATADRICKTWKEAQAYISDFLQNS